MSQTEDIDSRTGGTPNESIQTANALGVVVVSSTTPPTPPPTEPQPDSDPPQDPTKGEPVCLVDGAFLGRWEEYRIPGSIPLEITRVYRPNRQLGGPLGSNYTSCLDVSVVPEIYNRLCYRNEFGQRIYFERPFNFLASYAERYPYLALTAPWLKQLHLADGDLTRQFRQGKDRVYRLQRVVDGKGNAIDLDRSPQGLLTRLTHSDGYTIAFENDARGLRLRATLDAGGRQTQLTEYTYDRRGNLTSVECATAPSVRCEQDGMGRLRNWRTDTGTTRCELGYDGDGRVIRTQTNGPWNDDCFTYDPSSRRTLYRSGAPGHREATDYDEDGNIVRETDGLGAQWTYVHAGGRLVEAIDPLGHAKRYTYGIDGRMTSFTDAEGRRTLYRWNDGRLCVLVTGGDRVHRFTHNRWGGLTSHRDPLGNETRYSWSDDGLLTDIVSPDDGKVRLVHDRRRKLTQVYGPDGSLIRSLERSDPLGRLTRVANAAGGQLTFAYDDVPGKSLAIPTRITRSDGAGYRLEFDGDGNIVGIVDARNRRVAFTYGPFGLLASTTSQVGASFAFVYDNQARMIEIVDPLRRSYRYRRDLAGRIVETIDFDGRRTTFERDLAGRIVTRTDADGDVIRFEYDRAGVLVARRSTSPDGGSPGSEDVERFTRDGDGALLVAENAAGRAAFGYDKAGRLVDDAGCGYEATSTYDACGRRISRRLGGDVEDYSYDPSGRIIAAVVGVGGERHAIAFARDAAGREVGRRYGAVDLRQAFAAEGHLLHQSFRSASESTLDRRFAWNEVCELTEIVDERWGTTSFRTSEDGRIIEARFGEGDLKLPMFDAKVIVGMPNPHLELQSFRYDLDGRIATSGTSRAGDPTGRPMSPWLKKSDGDELVARGPSGERIHVRRSRSGRLIERRIERDQAPPLAWRFDWTAFDRISRCLTPAGREWTYHYDALGRRVRSTSGNAERCFAWDGDRIVRETWTEKGGSTSWHYLPGESVPVATTSDGAFLLLGADHMGCPREAYRADGSLEWSWQGALWMSFCRVLRRNGEVDDAYPWIGYPGQYFDAEMQLFYSRHRYYDPLIAQFASCDPLGLGGGTDPHAYVHNPTIMADPLGLQSLPLSSLLSPLQSIMQSLAQAGGTAPPQSNSGPTPFDPASAPSPGGPLSIFGHAIASEPASPYLTESQLPIAPVARFDVPLA